MNSLRGRNVIVTGGSSGIGLKVAHMLSESGAQVAITGRREDALKEALAQLGEGCWYHSCDMADAEQVEGFCEVARERWKSVDGIVNNAGVAPMGDLESTDLEAWNWTYAVNVTGPFLLVKGLLPQLRESDSPSIVNISSTLAEKAIPGMLAYNSSKAALNHMTRCLALELAPAIRVNAIMPAVVDTPIHEGRGMSSEDVQELAGMHPLGRVGNPEDIAGLTLFLLSDRAAWMTGAAIPVDGGMLAG